MIWIKLKIPADAELNEPTGWDNLAVLRQQRSIAKSSIIRIK